MEKIFTAKTLEEAKQAACEEFGVSLLDINFEIIDQPAKKLFGSKGDFRVRASCDIKNTDAPAVTATPAVSETPVSETPDCGFAVDYIGKILTALGVKDFNVNVKPSGENVLIDITGDDLGVIIGRRGETLDSLQYLAILANNRGPDSQNRPRVVIDCNGYREKRTETLETLAAKTAAKVLKAGRRVTLEPMNPYERRIIHSKVSEISGVYSSSIGEEPFRKVVISADLPKKQPGSFDKTEKAPAINRENRDSRDNRGKRDSRDSGVTGRTYKQSTGFSTSFEREYKRVPAPEVSQETADIEKNTSLYGKIEL